MPAPYNTRLCGLKNRPSGGDTGVKSSKIPILLGKGKRSEKENCRRKRRSGSKSVYGKTDRKGLYNVTLAK